MPVGQRERRAPGAAEDQPFVDAEGLAQALGVGDQMRRGVRLELAQRRRAPGPALVVDDDPVVGGVEEAAMRRGGAGPGPPWKNSTGRPLGLPLCSQYMR